MPHTHALWLRYLITTGYAVPFAACDRSQLCLNICWPTGRTDQIYLCSAESFYTHDNLQPWQLL